MDTRGAAEYRVDVTRGGVPMSDVRTLAQEDMNAGMDAYNRKLSEREEKGAVQ
jgi:hypothetical protein